MISNQVTYEILIFLILLIILNLLISFNSNHFDILLFPLSKVLLGMKFDFIINKFS